MRTNTTTTRANASDGVVVVQQGSILEIHSHIHMHITIQIDVNHVHVALETTVTPGRKWKTNIYLLTLGVLWAM